MNAASNNGGSEDDGKDEQRRVSGDDDDEDDRKPPAKEIHLTSNTDERRRRGRRMDNAFDSSSNLTHETSSISSWTSPFVARLPNSGSRDSFQDTAPKEKQGFRLPSLAAITPFSSAKNSENSEVSNDHHAPSFGNIQMILSLWISTLLLSIVYFAYLVLPAMAFSTAVFIVVSSAAFAQALFSSVQNLYHEAVTNGDGLGSLLLPASINEMLTETTMHELLSSSDSSTMNDYQYLALYFLPLSSEQLDAALARLSPRHRNRLHQPGIGQWIMGETTDPWRLLVGNRRYYRNHLEGRRMDTVMEQVADEEDSENSSLGLDLSRDESNSFPGGQESRAIRRLSLSEEDEEDTAEDAIVPSDDNSDEMDVIMDAMWTSALSTVVYPFLSIVYETIWPVATVSTSMVGMATGFAWIVRGAQLSNTSNTRQSSSSSSSSWIVTLGGGLTTVALSMVGARYGLRGMSLLQQSEGEETKHESKKKHPKKS